MQHGGLVYLARFKHFPVFFVYLRVTGYHLVGAFADAELREARSYRILFGGKEVQQRAVDIPQYYLYHNSLRTD